MNSALLIIASLLGLACFITLYLARKWPSSWRYGLLLAGNALLIGAIYFDPWWHIEGRGSGKDLLMFLLVNVILIPRIRRDEQAAQQAAKGINVKVEDPPRAVLVPLVITGIFFGTAIGQDLSTVRILALGGLLTIVGLVIHTHRSKGKPTRNVLVAVAWIAMVIGVLVRFGHSPWLTSVLSNR